MQGYKTTEESLQDEQNKERQDEVRRFETSVTENKQTAEQANDYEQRTANENGRAEISERIEPVDEHSKGDMEYQKDKLNEEVQKQIHEDETKGNDQGDEDKPKAKDESERSDETENGNGSKENKTNPEEQGAGEENHATDKLHREDVERYQAEGRTKSDEEGSKIYDSERKQRRSSNIKTRNRPLPGITKK